MSRREFPAKVKVAAFKRAKDRCEDCGAPLIAGKFHYDHDIPDGLTGEPTLKNCVVRCLNCHGVKTREKDIPTIAKAKRVQVKHIGAKKAKRKMPYRRFDGTPVYPKD